MIVKWNKDGLKVVPVIGENYQQVDSVTLLPGYNEVKEETWVQARKHCLDEIERGLIEEKDTKVEKTSEKVPDPKDPEKKIDKDVTKISAKKFKQYAAEEAEELVKDCWNLDTLKKWKKVAKESVRPVIMDQIERIEKHGEDRKKKLKGEDKDK
jgi:hypothetical protein